MDGGLLEVSGFERRPDLLFGLPAARVLIVGVTIVEGCLHALEICGVEAFGTEDLKEAAAISTPADKPPLFLVL